MTALFLASLLLQDPATVGMPRRIEGLVLPGSELHAKPLTDTRAPVVVRVENVSKHGTAHRYDLVYYVLVPGKYDLRDWLARVDGSSMDGVPPIPVDVRAAYTGPMRQVNDIDLGPMARLGGYRTVLWALGIGWVVALGAIVFVGRKRRRDTAAAAKPVTMADRLRPLVEKAATGALSRDEQAELERLLLAFWRKREGLEGVDVATALADLRQRETAGALLRALEEWLHRRDAHEVDIPALLKPYEHEMLA